MLSCLTVSFSCGIVYSRGNRTPESEKNQTSVYRLHFHGLTSYEQLNSFGAKRQKKLDPGFDSQG